MNRILLILAMLAVAISAAGAAIGSKADGDPEAWTVYTETADLHTTHSLTSTISGQTMRGTRAAGELLVDPETDIEWLKVDADGEIAFLRRSAIHRVHPRNIVQGNLPYGTEVVNRWWGVPLDYEPDDLVEVPTEFSNNSRDGYRLRSEARDALVAMLTAAKGESGVGIVVASAYRSGPTQINIYGRNTRRAPAQRFSAPPGHSEHQLGTTLDLTDPEGRHLFSRTYDRTDGGAWLENNGARFGFVRSYYPRNEAETGYISEPWHWRYVGRKKAGTAEKTGTTKKTDNAVSGK